MRYIGYDNRGEFLHKMEDGRTNPYESRIINISSHSKHSGDEVTELDDKQKEDIKRIFNHLILNYKFEKEA